MGRPVRRSCGCNGTKEEVCFVVKFSVVPAYQKASHRFALRCGWFEDALNVYSVFIPDHQLYYIAITPVLHLHNIIMLCISLKSGQSSL